MKGVPDASLNRDASLERGESDESHYADAEQGGHVETEKPTATKPTSKSFGSFQRALLSTARKKLSLMLSEVCQCQEKKAILDFSDKENLTFNILTYIAEEKIRSVHISKEEAQQFLGLLHQLNLDKEENICLDYSEDAKSGDEDNDPPVFDANALKI